MSEWAESWSDGEEGEDEMAVVLGLIEAADWDGIISKADFILSLEQNEKNQVNQPSYYSIF